MDNSKTFITLSQYAELAGVTHQTAWNYLKRGLFPGAYQLPGGATSPWRIPITKELVALLPAESQAAIAPTVKSKNRKKR